MDGFDFEGDEVTDFTAALPSAILEAPEAYPRGTNLTLQVQVRVKSVRIEEDRKGNLTRKHVLALEECVITDVLTPSQRRALLEAAELALTAPAEEYTVSETVDAADLVREVRDERIEQLEGQTTIEEVIDELRSEGVGF